MISAAIDGSETESVPGRESKRFRLDEFEGPLDLLLFLVRKNEVNIHEIPIASITEQFLSFLDGEAGVDLDDLSEFYSMAASLLYIKSRMLLPSPPEIEDAAEDPRQELIAKLIEYQKYKKITELMERREMEVEWSLERAKIQRTLPFVDEGQLWEKLDVWDLLKTFSSLVSHVDAESIIDLYEEVTIHEKVALIHELLETRSSFSFADLITKRQSILDFVCAFLAVLESVKYRIISIYQHRLFGDISIRRHLETSGVNDGPSV